MRHATALLLATVGLTGCAHTGWVRAGDRHAAAGQWEQAIDDYERAQGLAPGSKRVARRLDTAVSRYDAQREEQVREALAEAELALRRGDWPSVVMHVETAIAVDPESEIVGEVAWDAAQELKRLSAARVGSGAVLEGYSYALLAARLLPADPAMTAALGHARSALMVEAFAKADAGEFEEAHRLASAVRDSEAPELSAGVVEAIAGRWAASLHEGARRDESRGRLGTALGAYARAAEIGGSDEDRVARDRVASRLAEEQRFRVKWSGSTSREAKALRETIEANLSWDPRVAFGATGTYGVELTSVKRACAQTVTPATAEHRYVAGTRRVANPAWATASQDVRTALSQVRSAELDVEDRADEVAAAEDTVAWFTGTEWEPALDGLRVAEMALGEARRAESAAEASLREASELLDRARLDPAWGGTPIAELEALVFGRARALELARTEREIAEAMHWRAERAYTEADDELERLRLDLSRAREALSESRDDLRTARTRAFDAEARLDGTPPEIDEDVWETYRYAVEDVTRTCEVSASVAVRTAEGVSRTTLVEAWATHDRRHDAQPAFAIPADPLAFRDTDDALVGASIARIAATFQPVVEQGRDAHYAGLFARAAGTDDVNEATALYAAGLLLDPAAAPEGAVAWLEDTWDTELTALLGR